jgi:S-adenosylmethionine synthetase
VDRSAAYGARWVAKSLVKAGVCRRCLVQVAYAIGVSKPLSIAVISYGTSPLNEIELLQIVNDNFDLRPGVIIKELNLRQPIYSQTAANGHFGHESFPWEKPKELTIRPVLAAKLKKHRTAKLYANGSGDVKINGEAKRNGEVKV